MKNLIVVDGEVVEVKKVSGDTESGQSIELDDGREYIIFESHEDAGEAAQAHYVEMIENDSEEFICLVGEKSLVAWCLGKPVDIGGEEVSSLDEWLELWLDAPGEHFASYDGEEIEYVRFNNHLAKELGFFGDRISVVMYRTY